MLLQIKILKHNDLISGNETIHYSLSENVNYKYKT